MRTAPRPFTITTSSRTSVSYPLDIWAKYSSALAYRRFIWRGLTPLAARSKSLLCFASLRQPPNHHDPARSDQFPHVCRANGSKLLKNSGFRNIWKCTLLRTNPPDTTLRHDCGWFQRLCPSVIFSNVQRQLIYLSAWFSMRLGNGINSISHRHSLKCVSQNHV